MADGAAYHEKRLRETPELFDPIIRERLEAAKFFPAVDYIKANRLRSIMLDDMRNVFTQCDVLAVPAGGPTNKLDSPETAGSDVRPGRRAGSVSRGGSTAIGNLTGMPGIVIPCGFSSGSPSLPLAIQFYGKPFDEAALFRVSHAYESATDWHKRRPNLT